MSITKGFARFFARLKKKGFIGGESILQLGRQSTFVTYEETITILKEENLAVPDISITLGFDVNCKAHECIDDRTLFCLLGFKQVHSLDISSYEDATIIHDLNYPFTRVPNQYDVIYDGGTLEHVFSTVQALKNIYDLLKVGGTVIHNNPAHNHLDHGFYSFSPQMYHDFYIANRFTIPGAFLLEAYNQGYDFFNVYQYNPGQLELLQFGGYGFEMLSNWFMAHKEENSTCNVIPNQGISRTKYLPAAPHYEESSQKKYKQFLKKFPLIIRIAKEKAKISKSLTLFKLFFYQTVFKKGVKQKLKYLGKF